MKTVSRTTRFKRDFKRMVKRGKGPAELRSVVEMLCRDAKLPPKYRGHQLSDLIGNRPLFCKVAGMNYFAVEFGSRKGNSCGYKSR